MVVIEPIASLDFFAMTMGVNHQQQKDNQPRHEQNNDAWFFSPKVGYETGEVGIHPPAYSCSGQNPKAPSCRRQVPP
jgi:hypothetical protein